MKKDFKRFIFTWIILFLAVELIMSFFGIGKKAEEKAPEQILTGGIILETNKTDFPFGKNIIVSIKNLKEKTLEITEGKCELPFDVFHYNTTGTWEMLDATKKGCTEEDIQPIVLEPGQETKYSLLPWNYELFTDLGRYKIVLNSDKEYSSPEFVINKKGFLKRAWEFTFHKPIYNALIFLTDINPYKSFGLGIILLTFVIRLILLVPSQKALRSQKRMQEIQPKIQEIQKKYKGNQERISMETMALWKTAKVNPLGSCLPILLQFPVLIGLYYAVREVALGGSPYSLYEFQSNFDFASIDTMFLGILDLANKNLIALPIIIGLLQFAQMRLTFSMKKTPASTTPKKEGMPDMQSMNKTMSYTMPLMIAFFTASLPAGVGLYWGTSTLFAIGQSLVVNREKPEGSSKNSSEVTVRIIEKTEEEEREETKKKYLPKGKKK
ncbi:MAG: YidC/Oxa1 family membrane protein insertase [Candidatus Peregrinibacteria bacterium]|nr:YidC/Oxa1 family membrane protein insertase [Candidatus Peregrinibacteria bacterium]MDZ4244781.1 YidC/Oxa1 family membrane protein insertase [Candidatus Gracilibacteria bacterium]